MTGNRVRGSTARDRKGAGRTSGGATTQDERPTRSEFACALIQDRLLSGPTAMAAQRSGMLALQASAGNQAVAEHLSATTRTAGSPPKEALRDLKAPSAIDPEAADATDARRPGDVGAGVAQRKIGDGHDLTSPRFAGDVTLEGAFDNERVLAQGAKGAAVTKVQQALLDFGFRLPVFGADGDFGPETKAAVSSFQADSGLAGKELDGVVGSHTMTALDRRGGTYAGPGSALTPAAAAPLAPGLSVQVPGRIRATSTPETMAQDRIPPRIDTAVGVSISGFAIPMAPVTLSIAGSGAANGTVTIDGAPTATLLSAATVQLRGVTQTAPGSGGNLNLVASQNGAELARSAPFSVAAVPQFYTDAFVNDVVGGSRGVVVQDGWVSDSGPIADLDQVDISEQVETTVATGCFAGGVVGVSSYLSAAALTQDTHSDAVAGLGSPGHRVAQQTCMFRDQRTGVTDIPMRDSGFELDRLVTNVGAGRRYRITKRGKATTANGIPSGAGACNVVRPPQAV